VKKQITFTFVATMDEVARLALLTAPVPRADQLPSATEDDSPSATAPLADSADLDVGSDSRTPGARETVPLADVGR